MSQRTLPDGSPDVKRILLDIDCYRFRRNGLAARMKKGSHSNRNHVIGSISHHGSRTFPTIITLPCKDRLFASRTLSNLRPRIISRRRIELAKLNNVVGDRDENDNKPYGNSKLPARMPPLHWSLRFFIHDFTFLSVSVQPSLRPCCHPRYRKQQPEYHLRFPMSRRFHHGQALRQLQKS